MKNWKLINKIICTTISSSLPSEWFFIFFRQAVLALKVEDELNKVNESKKNSSDEVNESLLITKNKSRSSRRNITVNYWNYLLMNANVNRIRLLISI